MLDNAKCHSRIIEKIPAMNMKNDEMIAFMSKYDIEMPDPIPAKPVKKIRKKILKTTVCHWFYS